MNGYSPGMTWGWATGAGRGARHRWPSGRGRSEPRCRLTSLGVAVIKTAVPGLFFVSTDTL